VRMVAAGDGEYVTAEEDAAWGHAAYKRERNDCVGLAVRYYGRANMRCLSSLPGLDLWGRGHPPLKRLGYYRPSHEGTGNPAGSARHASGAAPRTHPQPPPAPCGRGLKNQRGLDPGRRPVLAHGRDGLALGWRVVAPTGRRLDEVARWGTEVEGGRERVRPHAHFLEA
jgi:hypothetical protein